MAPPHPAAGAAWFGGGSNTQTVRFLSSVLSQRGPTALPYTEDVKWLIRQHLLSLSDAYSSLVPQAATFTHNDGRSVNLLQADGTVPMSYQGVTYNIPVIIWLMESYPRHAPCVYVNPTRDMIIKRPHPYVDPSGLVRIPYLHGWIYPSSNLVELARNLSSYFGREPPLYSQRSNRANPNPNLGASSSGSVISSSSSGFSAAGSAVDGPRPSIPPRDYPPSAYVGAGAGRISPASSQQRPSSQTEDPNEVFKRNEISKIVDMANGDIMALRKTREAEMDGLVNIQQALRRRGGEMDKGLREMQGEKEALEHQLQMVLMNSDVLESWLRENEAKMARLGGLDVDVDVDEAFQPCDVLSKQILECVHSDLAIEDVVYSLDKAVQDGAISFDLYLKSVRLLSREQFFNRALGAKVGAAQLQSQVASMAARIQQYVG